MKDIAIVRVVDHFQQYFSCIVDITDNTIQYNKLYLKSENIKHYNTSSNELLNPT